MDNLYENLVTGLEEAIADARSKEKTLKRNTVVILPVKNYTAAEIKNIRNRIGFSQNLFASYIGVSRKTVEAWEKGTNENHNRIIRRWFPKGTDFTKVTKKEIREVQNWMNNYPRKILNWNTPNEMTM